MNNLNTNNDKIWFAQILRGLAALIVIYAHLGELFWRDNTTSSLISYSSPIQIENRLPHLYLTDWLYQYHINFGSIGVALFFLVSGFVIPISIEKIGPSKFLFRRIFRLYPTYAAGLLFTFIVLYMSAHVNGISFNFSMIDYFKNVSLFRDWFWVPSIDNVNWTLETEIKFYLLCAFLAWVSALKNPKSIMITSGILGVLTFAASSCLEFLLNNNLLALYKVFYISSNASVFLTFMFIGTCFYNLFKKNWSKMTFITGVGFLSLMFIVNVHNVFGSNQSQYLVNYLLVVIIFSVVYIFRENMPQLKILDFLAKISYPLYVIHGVAGYAIISFLFKYQPYPYLVLIEVVSFMFLLSYAIHRFIELPTNRLGYFLSKLRK